MAGSHKLGLLKKKNIAITDFWGGLTSFPLLQAIANVMFNVVCSSAAAERNFLTHTFVHSTLRNRLTPARVDKLGHMFFNDADDSDQSDGGHEDEESLDEDNNTVGRKRLRVSEIRAREEAMMMREKASQAERDKAFQNMLETMVNQNKLLMELLKRDSINFTNQQ
ncbi:hypothetical protein PF010_g874 [Phytophthora fragariae]|uniref:HAT C-terminal dimerisation domain-containing protein n=1 Tax=Phytophthora fragariae TaxID=53985 RepID=A0A6G0M2P7_9STRA|nr:hypothetical protein PF003_g13405 [Phytophthora fragariae]KAE9138649.1 hypothetical protein PF010_g874 [Phytophthora fragariae]